MPQPKNESIEYVHTDYGNSFDKALVKAEPKSKEEQKRDAERIKKEWEKNRQQNPSYGK